MIIKEAHGSFGMKVYLIENREQFFAKIEELAGIEYDFFNNLSQIVEVETSV